MKRVVVLLLVSISLLCTSCGLSHFSFDQDKHTDVSDTTDNGDEYITRGEWAEMLGGYFGMDSCLNDQPYYTDVTADNQLFPYIQACTEWEVFDQNEKNFKPDEFATVDFIIDSAVKASEADYSSFPSALAYAKSINLNPEQEDSNATRIYANQIAEWALETYQNRSFTEYENIKYKTDVYTVPAASDENGKVTVSDNKHKFSAGDIIIIQGSEEDLQGIARKVSAVNYTDDGSFVLDTVEPEIGEVFDELEFAHTGTVTDASTIKTEKGVMLETISPASAEKGYGAASQATTLDCNLLNRKAEKVEQLSGEGTDLSFSVKINSDKKKTFSQKYQQIEVKEEAEVLKKTGYVVPKASEIAEETKKLAATDLYESGWDLEGNIALKDFYIKTQLKTKKAFGVPYGIQSFDYEVHYKLESSLKYSGKIEEEIKIATVPIPVCAGVMLNFELIAKASANGDVEISSSVETTSSVKYTEENGYKKTQTSECEKNKELSVDFKVGFGGKAILKAVGIKLIDVTLDVEMEFETAGKITKVLRYEGKLYRNFETMKSQEGMKEGTLICIDGTGYYPIVSLEIGMDGETLAHKLGIKLKVKIIDKNGAIIKSNKSSMHFEFGIGLVDQCSLDTLQVLDGENDTTDNDNSQEGVMSISSYAVSLKSGESAVVTVSALPEGYRGSDVEWISEDSSIVKIQRIKNSEDSTSCELKATGAGITSVIANTTDKKHSVRCAVIIKENEGKK